MDSDQFFSYTAFMGRRSDHSREELESLFLDAGEAHMAEAGFARFSAREVAKRIGYSVGTLYNVFGSYDRFILAINTRTLRRWTEALEARLAESGEDRIAALVHGYFDFAGANISSWLALYDHRMPPGEPLGDDFHAAFGELIGLVEREVAGALGRETDASTHHLTGSLLALVHGHCTFALNGTWATFGGDAREAALERVREALRKA
jgi:AcrR family transcriptional regulator